MQKRVVEPQADETRPETEQVAVHTRLTAEQFEKDICSDFKYASDHNKGETWLVLQLVRRAEAFRDKSEAGLREEIERLDKENEVFRQLNEQLNQGIRELRAKLAEQGHCCGDAHHELESAMEMVKAIGFEEELIESEHCVEHIWHNRRAEAAEAEVAALRELLKDVHAQGCACQSADPAWHSNRCHIPKVWKALSAAPEAKK